MFSRILLSVSAFLLLFLLPISSGRSEGSFTAELVLQTENIIVNESFSVSLVLRGTGDASIASVNVPIPPEFIQQGTSQSSRMTVVNGKMNSEFQLHTTILPQKTGTFSLGPATVVFSSGEKIQSNILSLSVISPPEIHQKDNSESSEASFMKDEEHIPEQKKVWNTTAVLLLVIGVCAGGISFLLGRKKNRISKVIPSEEFFPPKTPDIIIPHVSEDDAVFAKKLLSALRLFISHTEGISAEEMTSREILAVLQERSSQLLPYVQPLLETLDGALFARKSLDKTNLLHHTHHLFSSFPNV